MSFVWAFRSCRGGTGQTSLVLNLGIAAANAGVKVLLVDGGSNRSGLRVAARQVDFGVGEFEHLQLKPWSPNPLSQQIAEAKALADLVLVDAASYGDDLFAWADREVLVITPDALNVSSARHVVATQEHAHPICVVANRVPSIVHGEQLIRRFNSLCGSSASRSVDSLGSVPESLALKYATRLGIGVPGFLSWSPVSKAFASVYGTMAEFEEQKPVEDPFDLRILREPSEQAAA